MPTFALRPEGLCAPLLSFVLASSAAAQCLQWNADFYGEGPNGTVYHQEVLGLGAASQLILCGEFDTVGTVRARNIAAWDGSSWTAFGDGPSHRVRDVAIFDDGSGPALYAAGWRHISRWDGLTWTETATSGEVFALCVHDDGSGPALYAGGNFTLVGQAVVWNLGRLQGGTWSSVGGGTSSGADTVFDLEVHDDGGGNDLYVGGTFFSIGGVSARCIARWDGASFSAFGAVNGQNPRVYALESFTPPGGPSELHVGGRFQGVAGQASPHWARWSNGAWSPVGGATPVYDLAVHTEGAATFVFGGREGTVDRFDGTALTSRPIASTALGVSLASFTADLYVTTTRISTSTPNVDRWLVWTGSGWEASASGLGLPGSVADLIVHDFGFGRELVAISPSPIVDVALVAAFDGRSWRPIGGAELGPWGGLNLANHAGELYTLAPTVQNARYVAARFDGTTWQPFGGLLPSFTFPTCIASFDDGNGPVLYVGGYFDDLGVPGTDGLARWNGTAWESVAGSLTANVAIQSVGALVVWDDGSGPALYAGGQFTEIGGVPVNHIAKWDGQTWSPLGGGVEWLGSGTFGGDFVVDLEVFDSPHGEVLVASGTFDLAGGAPASNIAAWDGTSWAPLGGGLSSSSIPVGSVLGAADPDGRGERLYVSGIFDAAGGIPAAGAAVWDGFTWSPLDVEGGLATAFQSYATRNIRSVFAAGGFSAVEGTVSEKIARAWDSCGDVAGDPICTSTVNSTGRRALLRASRSLSVTAANLEVVARYLPPGAPSIFALGTTEVRLPLGDGLLCIGGSIARMLPVGAADPAGERRQAFDFAAPYAQGAVAGATLVLQAVYRDLAGGPAGFNTTDGLALTFLP